MGAAMSRCFPKLTQTHVWIEDGSGSGFSCPMLPVSKIGELKECSEKLGSAKTVSEIAEIRDRMVELAKVVMPEQYHAGLLRLDLPTLTKLLAYLMYGDNDDQAPPKN